MMEKETRRMFEPSQDTLRIREIVELMSDADFLTKGPSDLREAVEKIGLDYESVRNIVNNELARARRKRGIRKGRGRRVAAPASADGESELRRLAELFERVDHLGKCFESWTDARGVIEEVISLIDALGGAKELLEVVDVKQQNEKDDVKAGRIRR